MAHSIHYDEPTGIYTVTQTGTVTLESRLKMLADIKAQITDESDVKVLSDLRNADIVMTSDELIQYGEVVASEPRSKRARLATVYNTDEPVKYLTESMVHLQGDNVKVASFTSMEEAYQWLLEA